MSRVIDNNMVTINTQEFKIDINVNTNKSSPSNSNKHMILQQEKQVWEEDQQFGSNIISQ